MPTDAEIRSHFGVSLWKVRCVVATKKRSMQVHRLSDTYRRYEVTRATSEIAACVGMARILGAWDMPRSWSQPTSDGVKLYNGAGRYLGTFKATRVEPLDKKADG